jgi:hypothetical protein
MSSNPTGDVVIGLLILSWVVKTMSTVEGCANFYLDISQNKNLIFIRSHPSSPLGVNESQVKNNPTNFFSRLTDLWKLNYFNGHLPFRFCDVFQYFHHSRTGV